MTLCGLNSGFSRKKMGPVCLVGHISTTLHKSYYGSRREDLGDHNLKVFFTEKKKNCKGSQL